MVYTQRTAQIQDAPAIAPLYEEFLRERAQADPALDVKPDFDFQHYVARELESPRTYGFVVEYRPNQSSPASEIVGFLLTYAYDEAPPSGLSMEVIERHELSHPFVSRRVGTVLGLFVKKEHRSTETITGLIEQAISRAEELKLTDIDLLISAEQKGLHALLERHGFTRSAVQYSKHYEVDADQPFPELHPTISEVREVELPTPQPIPLRNEKGELVSKSNGNQVYLYPITNKKGEVLYSSRNRPIYSQPLLDPQTKQYIFDESGELITHPLLREKTGEVVEYQGIPKFHPPEYKFDSASKTLSLKRDCQGNYIFREAELDEQGKVKRTPDGKPLFKNRRS